MVTGPENAVSQVERLHFLVFLYSSARFKTNSTYPFLLLVVFVFVFLFRRFVVFIPRADRGVVYMRVLEKFGGFGGFVAMGLGAF